MKRFEYLQVELSWFNYLEQLNEYGLEGWEVITALLRQTRDGDIYEHLLKRELDDET